MGKQLKERVAAHLKKIFCGEEDANLLEQRFRGPDARQINAETFINVLKETLRPRISSKFFERFAVGRT